MGDDVKAIKYKEIRKATKKFDRSLLLGEGTSVYKGWLHEQNLTAVKPGSGNGIAVAIKKTYLDTSLDQEHEEWAEIIKKSGQLRHPNIVKLIGYSFDKNIGIVGHEFIDRGSLDNHLFQREHEWLSWETRMKVATGAARGVAFLHGLEIPLMHGSVDSSHILLDADFNAKLSDWGRTSYKTHEADRSVIIGSRCTAAAPEFISTGQWTTRCDVYSFGVVLLELVSGLRAIDRNRPKRHLIDWARPYLGAKKELSRIMDSRLEGQYPPKEAFKVAKIAIDCVSKDPRSRPIMSEVVARLQNL